MGNTFSVSAESVYSLAKSGDFRGLQVLLTEVQRRGSASDVASYIEFRNLRGWTPLMVASANGHAECVNLLLRARASVTAVSAMPEGTTALHLASNGHSAAVDALLKHGANPFIEDGKRMTAFDVAVSCQSALVLRRLEASAPFAGLLGVKESKWGGLGSSWQQRWVCIMHRLPGPATPAGDCVVRKLLCCYRSADAAVPFLKVWLDGASARLVPASKPFRPMQCEVSLHRSHVKPENTFVTGEPGASYVLHLRPASDSAGHLPVQQRFVEAVNQRYGVPNGRPQSQGARTTPQPQQHRPRPLQPNPGVMLAMGPLATGAARRDNSFGHTSPSVTEHSGESDEQLARRLQVGYDADLARDLSHRNINSENRGQGHGADCSRGRARSSSSGAAAPSARSSSSGEGHAQGAHAQQAAPTWQGASLGLPSGVVAASSPPPRPPSASGGQATPPGWIAKSQAEDAAAASPAAAAAKDTIVEDLSEDNMCVICMDSPATAGFLHGSSVHKCCCQECASLMSSQSLCPVCREPIQHVILKIF